ncbi:hypothetical protein Ciccas_010870, partial [Cichlidogyrus casuarinus]
LQKHNEILFEKFSAEHVLHSMVSLYHRYLREMEQETLYSAINNENAFTILVTCSSEEARSSFSKNAPNKGKIESLIHQYENYFKTCKLNTCTNNVEKEISSDKTEPESKTDVLKYVFLNHSDSEEEVEEQTIENNTDDFDLSKGFDQFIDSTYSNNLNFLKHLRNNSNFPRNAGLNKKELDQFLNPNNFIVAACTFNIKYCSGRRIAHLDFLAVEKNYQRQGLGKSIIDILKQKSTTGPIDAIVVHADTKAVDFFAKMGFVDDMFVNSCWKDIADDYVNCQMMTYLPSFVENLGPQVLSPNIQDNKVNGMVYKEKIKEAIKEHKIESENAHRNQTIVHEKIMNDMQLLVDRIHHQDNIISDLMLEIRSLTKKNMKLNSLVSKLTMDLPASINKGDQSVVN